MASMGPRSDNRGYGALITWKNGYGSTVGLWEGSAAGADRPVKTLQWVHGRITVVMSCPLAISMLLTSLGFNGSTVG